MKSAVNSFWKLPVYCLVMGWVCFELEVLVLRRFFIIIGPDNMVKSDPTGSFIVSGILLLLVVLLGGLTFCRRMSRQEVIISATVLAVLSAVLDLVCHFTNSFSVFWATCSEWDSFVSLLVYRIIPNEWVSAIVGWLTPFVFVPFGRHMGKKRS